MSDSISMLFPRYMNEKSADVKFIYVEDIEYTEFHFAWVLEDETVIAVEFNDHNWPLFGMLSHSTVTDYLESIGPESYMSEHRDVIKQLMMLVEDHGCIITDQTQWIIDRYKEHFDG